jgi:FkbM family methyltransferase
MSKLLNNFLIKIHKVLQHKNPFRYFVYHTWKRLVGFLYLHIHILTEFYQPIIKRNGYKLLMTPTLFSVLLYRYPDLDREDEDVISSLLKEGMVYVDVGANIGTTTLAAAHAVGNSGHVYAFEAHPVTARGLQKSVDINHHLKNRVTIRSVALGEKVGVTHMSNLDMDDLNFVTTEGVEVRMSTLDKELENIKHIDLLKIDVEGYEKYIFDGAIETLTKTDKIYFESFEPNFRRFGYTLDAILQQLHNASFIVYSIKGGQYKEVYKGYRNEDIYENLLAVRK